MPTRIDELFQLFADFEKRQTLGGHGYRLARARIPPRVGLVGSHGEAAVATDLNAFATLQRFGHRVEHAIDDHFCSGLGQLPSGGNGLDELTFGHLLVASLCSLMHSRLRSNASIVNAFSGMARHRLPAGTGLEIAGCVLEERPEPN